MLRDLDVAGVRANCERALRIDQAADGPDHPEVATGPNTTATLPQELGPSP